MNDLLDVLNLPKIAFQNNKCLKSSTLANTDQTGKLLFNKKISKYIDTLLLISNCDKGHPVLSRKKIAIATWISA